MAQSEPALVPMDDIELKKELRNADRRFLNLERLLDESGSVTLDFGQNEDMGALCERTCDEKEDQNSASKSDEPDLIEP